jgi:hypothetical protein
VAAGTGAATRPWDLTLGIQVAFPYAAAAYRCVSTYLLIDNPRAGAVHRVVWVPTRTADIVAAGNLAYIETIWQGLDRHAIPDRFEQASGAPFIGGVAPNTDASVGHATFS